MRGLPVNARMAKGSAEVRAVGRCIVQLIAEPCSEPVRIFGINQR